MAMTPAHRLNLLGVLWESVRIVNADSPHFLALSLFFLLPLWCSIVIYPILYLPNPRPDDVSSVGDYTLKSPQTLILPIIYTLVFYLLSICALAAITHSTYHGFYGRPVKFLSAIKSIVFSFFPLVSTAIAAKFFICLISMSFLMFVVVIVKLSQDLGFVIDYNSSYFLLFCAFVGVDLSMVMVYFQVNWGLAPVVAVAESKWGFEPLWRSSYLVNGMRSVSLSLLLVFGGLIGLIVWMTPNGIVWMTPNGVLDFDTIEGWWSWDFVLQIIGRLCFLGNLTFVLLYYTAANTVLYMYCKALHGELAIENAEEFAREYVSLPFDDAKVPHVVTVVSA